MNFFWCLALVEIIPILLWIIGGTCESKATKFPNIKIGYRSKFSMKNKLTWEYSNKLLAQIAGSMGTFIFIMNAIIMFSFGINGIKFIIITNVIGIILVIFIIEKSLKKKFNKNGEFKNN